MEALINEKGILLTHVTDAMRPGSLVGAMP